MGWNNTIFPLLIVTSGSGFTGLFEYSPGPGASNLITSAAAAAGTDPYGNAYLPGLVTYTTSAPFIAIQVFNGKVQFYHATSQAGPWNATGPLIEDLAGALAFLSGTFGAAVTSNLTLTSAATQAAASAAFNAPVILANQSATPPNTGLNQSSLFASAGHLKTVSSSTGGDGSTWRTERVRQSTTATQQFTLASAVAITGLSQPLGVGTYHVRLKTFWVPSGVVGSSHTQQFAFTGTATGNVNGQCWQAQAASAVQQASLNAGAGNNLTASLSSPTHVAFPGWTEMDADITVTVAGTLTSTITLITAGDDITTSAGTYWEITPEA